MHAVGLIPARFHASRFPGKLLARLGDRTVIEHVLANASRSSALDRVCVVTDNASIGDVARRAGGDVFMSQVEHESGSDRIGEAVDALGLEASLIVNVQGDEPLLGPEAIDACVASFHRDPSADIATLATACEAAERNDPGVVKVVSRSDGRALYFSRSTIPSSGACYKHIGIYAFAPGALQRFVAMPAGQLERAERLEQLRALEAGMTIQVTVGMFTSIGIDTPEDLALAADALKAVSQEGKG